VNWPCPPPPPPTVLAECALEEVYKMLKEFHTFDIN
jgi:hypothetical protein